MLRCVTTYLRSRRFFKRPGDPRMRPKDIEPCSHARIRVTECVFSAVNGDLALSLKAKNRRMRPALPLEELRGDSPVLALSGTNCAAMELVVRATVLGLLPDPSAHLEAHLGSHRDVTAVEACVDVAAEEQAVPRVVRAVSDVRPDLSGFQERQGPLAGHGAPPLLGVRDHDSEGSLAEAWQDRDRRPIPMFRHEGHPFGRLIVRRYLAMRSRISSREIAPFFSWNAVPGEAQRQDGRVSEESSAHDELPGRVELE